MIVLDASAAIPALLNDGAARSALAGERIAVPHLIDSQVSQTLRLLLRAGHLTAAQGRAALEAWMRMGVNRHPATGLLTRVWELRDNLSAYDATYVALAEALKIPLLTADARLSRAPGIRCSVTVVPR